MNKITQYRPAFFEGFDNATVEFETVEELLAIPFLQGFKHEGFDKFSIGENYLMAEYRGGREWWVAGRIQNPESVNLPQWNGGIYETVEGEFPSKDVTWSDATSVCLKDGRILRKP